MEKKFEDKELLCSECNNKFISTAVEQEFISKNAEYDLIKGKVDSVRGSDQVCPICRNEINKRKTTTSKEKQDLINYRERIKSRRAIEAIEENEVKSSGFGK